MSRPFLILALIFLAFVVAASLYGCGQYEQLQEHEAAAARHLATLEAETRALERTIQLREDSLVSITLGAERAELAAGRYRRRAAFLLSALDQPTPEYHGSDSSLADAMAAHYRGHR